MSIVGQLDQAMHSVNFIPENERKGLTVNAKEAYPGYTLFGLVRNYVSPVNGKSIGAFMVDMDGKVVNEWEITGIPAKMFPGGILIGGKGTGTAQGGSATFARYGWNGKEIADPWGVGEDGRPITVTDIVKDPLFGGVHHDFQIEGSSAGYYSPNQNPNPYGKMLVLGNYFPCGPNNGKFQASCGADENDTNEVSPNFNLMDDVFYEIDAKGAVTFAWHHYAHVDQMGYDDKARDAVATMFSGPPGFGGSDWQHSNTVDYLGQNKWYNCEGRNCLPDQRFHPENILYDSRTSNYLAIIARYDHPDGKSWKAGDIVWRVGPHFTPANAESKLDQIIGPHMAHMIPDGLPGAGNILVFDNGGVAGYGSLLPGLPGYYPNAFRDFSRVIEFNPKSLEIAWEYTHPEGDLEGRKFYSRFISGAQRLSNGNTLITDGCYGRVFEVTKGGKIVWEYINPNSGVVGGPPIPSIGSNAVYRAYRIPAEWVPIK